MLEQLKKEVFKRRPILENIYKEYSKQTLKEYVKNFWEIPQIPPDPEFLNCVEEILGKIYGSDLAKKTKSQLIKKPLVSTVDHLGIWNHPIFVNSDLIYSLNFSAGEMPLVLATESVSLNNTSSWSGSLLEHYKGELKRYSFFPDSEKTLPVFSAPPFNEKHLASISRKLRPELLGLLKAIEVAPALDLESFSSQASVLSHNFWRQVFPSAPQIVYCPLESLVMSYILKTFQDSGHFLAKLILSQEGRDLWQKYFPEDHTFMFWGINKKGRREALSPLQLKGMDVALEIRNRKIYPSSPLCFVSLLFAGLACAGGFTQTTWFTEVKQKFLKLLTLLGFSEQAKKRKLGLIPTKNFAESTLAFLKNEQGLISPSGTDLFLTGKDYYPAYVRLASTLTLGNSLDLAMPTIYKVIVPQKEQYEQHELSQLEAQLLRVLKLEKTVSFALEI